MKNIILKILIIVVVSQSHLLGQQIFYCDSLNLYKKGKAEALYFYNPSTNCKDSIELLDNKFTSLGIDTLDVVLKIGDLQDTQIVYTARSSKQQIIMDVVRSKINGLFTFFNGRYMALNAKLKENFLDGKYIKKDFSDVMTIGEYTRGKKEGAWYIINEATGKLFLSEYYKNNLRDGIQIGFRESGMIWYYLLYKGGAVIDGEYTTFYPSGKIEAKITYKNGEVFNTIKFDE
jgi:antitoxin component YwqK of YwqJK toxin-antitoxin module